MTKNCIFEICKATRVYFERINKIFFRYLRKHFYIALFRIHRKHRSVIGIVDKIQECVEQYYQDANLSVGFIAEKLNRNAKYISRVFKEENGKGISNYISEIRIQKAREIMQMQKYTLEEVAEMVGYSNSRTFRRAFVKIVGELPSKFM